MVPAIRGIILVLALAGCGGSPGPVARAVDAGEDYAQPDAPACIATPDAGVAQPCSDDTACAPPKVCQPVCGGGAACY